MLYLRCHGGEGSAWVLEQLLQMIWDHSVGTSGGNFVGVSAFRQGGNIRSSIPVRRGQGARTKSTGHDVSGAGVRRRTRGGGWDVLCIGEQMGMINSVCHGGGIVSCDCRL